MANSKASSQRLYTLTEIAKKTKISMPTLQRYKKLYQNRIPSVGSGRSQRYPEESLAVFLELKKENIGKRGRPRKNAAASAVKKSSKTTRAAKKKTSATKKASARKTPEGLLTLTQVSKMTGISYPTLLRYVKTNLKQIPHKGTGRSRRFLPEAVDVFKSLRERSKRGRKSAASKAAAAKPAAKTSTKRAPSKKGGRRGRPAAQVDPSDLLVRVKELEKAQKMLERLVAKQQRQIEKPFRVVLKR